MNITGIIAEYNPFHYGHKYHIEKAKEKTKADGIIVIMSGNFMQRGIPAIVNKFSRAQMAIYGGADLVIELPLIHSVASAEYFAQGAVTILDKLKICNNLFFGAENDNINNLTAASLMLSEENSSFKDNLNKNLKLGLPYHKARSNALMAISTDINFNDILKSSNNILAIEYIKAINKLKSNIKPYALKRQGSSYNDNKIAGTFSSATAIRKNIYENKNIKDIIPKETYNKLLLNKPSFPEDMFPYIKYKLLTCSENLSKIPDTNEGLDKKIIKEIANSNSFDNLILNIKSKRYTYTRISRILTSFFIGLENYNINNLRSDSYEYIRPLAFNNTGRKILKIIKENSETNIITKIPKSTNNSSILYDIQGTKAYSIINASTNPYDDYFISPSFIDL